MTTRAGKSQKIFDGFSTPKDFTESLKAIAELENALSCNKCQELMQIPVILWSCDHVFCKECSTDMNNCSVCNLPSWVDDHRENKAVTSVAQLTASLKDVLESYMIETNQIKKPSEIPHGTEENENEFELPVVKVNKVNHRDVTKSTVHDKPTQRRSKKITPNRPFPDISEDTEDDVENNSESADTNLVIEESDFDSTTVPLHDVVNKVYEFATPSPPKRKRLSRTPYTPRTTSGLSTPQRSPSVRTPKTPKSAKKNKRGETLLHIAAIKNNMDDLKMLIQDGADVNAKDNAGWTPLHEACNHGHIDIVSELLDAGALVNIPGYDDETPLIDAVINGHADIVRLLLERGADMLLRTSHGQTASDLTKEEDILLILDEHLCLTQAAMEAFDAETGTFQDSAPENIVIGYSSNVNDERIKKSAEILNAKFDKKDTTTATHYLVANSDDNKCRRTIKYMQSVARGIWILTNDWLEACIAAGSWVNERNFEVQGSKEDMIQSGPKRSRLNKTTQCPAIFHGCHFYLYGYFKPPTLSKQLLGELLQMAGGTLLTREPKPDGDSVQACTKVPYHAHKDSALYYYTYYIVYDSSHSTPSRMVRQGKVCTVPLSWVLDCISQFYLCEIPD